MQRYAYKALDVDGRVVHGTVESDSDDMAVEEVTRLGQTTISVKARGRKKSTSSKGSVDLFQAPVKPQQLILFTRQLSTLLRTGVPIIRAMEILADQSESRRLKQLTIKMQKDLQDGGSLSSVMSNYPDVFNTLYIGMVYAGENSGAMPKVLERLTYIIEHEHKVKSDVKAALRYPMMVLVALAGAFMVLLNFVIPKFVVVFSRTGLVLPMPTKVCMKLSGWMAQYWFEGLLVVSVLVMGVYLALRTSTGRYYRDVVLLKLPILGPVLIKTANSRFASLLAILQATGVAILDAMNILESTMGNAAVSREINKIQQRLTQGHGLSKPLRSAKYFTPMLVNMVAIGEESGTLDEMLDEVSKHYDTEVDYALKQLSDAIGPILIVLLSGVIGFFALAIYLPMFDLTKMLD
ncbi:MAG: type IV pilus assembly protein PilC [Kiritimatiellia bacterium]|jgi:type IV pilus assembly protein PilC